MGSSRRAGREVNEKQREKEDYSVSSFQPASRALDKFVHLSVGLFCSLQVIRCLPQYFSLQGIGWALSAFGIGLLVGAVLVVLGLVGFCWVLSRPVKLADVYQRRSRSRKTKKVSILQRFGSSQKQNEATQLQKLTPMDPKHVPEIQIPSYPSPPDRRGIRKMPQQSLPPRYSRNGQFQGWLFSVRWSKWDEEEHLPMFPPPTDGPTKVATLWYAAIKQGNLIFRNFENLQEPQVVVPLEGCSVRVIKGCLKAKPIWWKKGPLEVRHPFRELLHDESVVYLFAASSFDKQQWYKAIKFTCDKFSSPEQPGLQAKTEILYRQYCTYVRKRAPVRFLRLTDIQSQKNSQQLQSQQQTLQTQQQQKGRRRWRFRFNRNGAPQTIVEGTEKVNEEKSRRQSEASNNSSKTSSPKTPKQTKPAKEKKTKDRKSSNSGENSNLNAIKTPPPSTSTPPPPSPFITPAPTPAPPPPLLPESQNIANSESYLLKNQAQLLSGNNRKFKKVRSFPSLTPEDIDRKWMKGSEAEQVLSSQYNIVPELRENYIVLPKPSDNPSEAGGSLKAESPVQQSPPQQPQNSELPFTDFLNMFLSRWGFDLLRTPAFQQGLQQKLQQRLDEINVPKFLAPLKVVDINVGTIFPGITSMRSQPSPTDTVWPRLEMDIAYQGDFSMTIETCLDVSQFSLVIQARRLANFLVGNNSKNDVDEDGMDYMEFDPAEIDTEPNDLLVNPSKFSQQQSSSSNQQQQKDGEKKRRLRLKNLQPFRRAAGERIAQLTNHLSNYRYTVRLRCRLKKFKATVLLWVPPPPGNQMFLSFIGVPELKMETRPIENRALQVFGYVSAVGPIIESRILRGLSKAMVYPSNVEIPIRGLLEIDNTLQQNTLNLPKEFLNKDVVYSDDDDENDDNNQDTSVHSQQPKDLTQSEFNSCEQLLQNQFAQQNESDSENSGEEDEEELEELEEGEEEGGVENVSGVGDVKQVQFGEMEGRVKSSVKKGKIQRLGKEAWKRIRQIRSIRRVRGRKSLNKERRRGGVGNGGIATPDAGVIDYMDYDQVSVAYSDGDRPPPSSNIVEWDHELFPVMQRSKSMSPNLKDALSKTQNLQYDSLQG